MTFYRSKIFTPVSDPFRTEGGPGASYRYFDDGYLSVDGAGRITAVGDWSSLPSVPEPAEIVEFGRRSLLCPGFVDCHLHGPQLEMIGSYGGHLLEWLERYTFPTEAKFADRDHAKRVAESFYEELLRNGTLAALVFSTAHSGATEEFLLEAERRGFRAIVGKALMDRNAPEALLEPADRAYEESRRLLMRWQDHPTVGYAISPRFAPTCTPRLLEVAAQLRREFPRAYVHTHLSENAAEVQWVRELFPEARDYVDVYDRAGLLGERSILAHGIHLSDRELAVLAERDSRICHCPNSNLFLGSGLFPLRRVRAAGVAVALGTDIGAGTTPSMFNAMADAYKVQQVQGVSLSPFHLWYLATLGGARALSLDSQAGSIEPGKEADFIVLDLEATPLLRARVVRAGSIEDLLAGLIFMGDDRVVSRSYIRGREVFRRAEA